MSFIYDFKNVFTRSGNGLVKIIVITSVIFVFQNIIDNIAIMSGSRPPFIRMFALPAGFISALLKPWTLITYMFLHDGLLHILFNMLWLYWIGKIFVEFVNSKRLVAVYFLGGIAGALLFLLLEAMYPMKNPMVGASAGVTAVVIATAVLLPDYVIYLLFFGRVRLKYLALIAFVLTSLIDLSQNTGGKIAHIGGALFGGFFMLQYKRGTDITKPFLAFFDWIASLFANKPKVRINYVRKKVSDEEYNANQRFRQQKIDQILDKISKSGYDALTKEEKDFLFKMSGKN